MAECWTCGSRSHSDNNCPYRVTRRLRVDEARDVKRATVKEAVSEPPKHADAQARTLTSSAFPNANVHYSNDDPNDRDGGDGPDNDHDHGSINGDGLNGSRKSPRQWLPPMGGEQQSRLNSNEGTSSERRPVASSNQRTEMAPTISTAESEASPSSNYAQNAIVNGHRNKSISNGDGRPSGHASSSLPPRGTLVGASSFDSSSLVDELRRRSIAGPVTRRAGYLEYRKAFVGWGAGGEGDGLAGGSLLRTPQGEMTRRKGLDASSGLRRREQRRRHERRRPRRISGEVVAYQAAKHAVEDLFTAPPLQIGVALLAFAFAVSASSRALFISLWSIVLSLGVTLWIRADVPTRSQRASSLHFGTSRWPRRAQPWVEMEGDDDRVEGKTGKVRRGAKGVLSVVNTRRLVMALVIARFAVDVVSVFWFYRLAIRTESPWLALVLFQASAVYAVSKGAAVAARGQRELRCGTNFRYLVAFWHTTLLLAAAFEAVVASPPLPRFDGAALRECVGSTLVGVAAWQLSKVSERRVERASRFGLVLSLEKVLRNADGRELSKEAMLEVAFGRWLVDYWSQPPSFSAPEMRCMLTQAAYSLASREFSPRVSLVGVRDCLRDGVSKSPPAEACTSGSAAAAPLTECLYDRTGSPPSKRLETALETLNPSWWSCLSLLLVMRCPALCALPVLVFHQALWGPPASWTAVGFVLALLAGPVGVEVLRLKLMADEMCGGKAGEGISFRTGSSANDSLSFLLRRTNQGLSCVLVNARCALESLHKFLREDENGGGNATGNEAAVSSVTQIKSRDQQQKSKQHVVFHDKTRTLRDVFDGIGKEGVERSASWIARESPSPPVSYYRSVEDTTSPGRLSSSRTNNSLGLTRKPPPSPKPSAAAAVAAAAAAAVTAAAAVAAANGEDGKNFRREGRGVNVTSEPELTVAGEAVVDKPPLTKATSTTTSKNGSRKGENGVVGGTSEEILTDQAPLSPLPVDASSPDASPLKSRAKTPPVEAVREAGGGDEDWVSGAGHAIVGTTLAVVGVADGLIGTIKDVAGGAVGSIQVLTGVFGLFGVREGQQ